jgi:beta-mannosidase
MTLLLLHNGWNFRQAGAKDWAPAIVPGCVHMDLQRIGKIPDPFFGRNEHQLQWIEMRDWEYRLVFDAPQSAFADEHQELVFDGLDTLAVVTLNGKKILESDNMFVGHRVSVGEIIKPHGNELRVLFLSAGRFVRERRKEHISPREFNDTVGGCAKLRKQQCQFGWDWAPRLVTCGLWRSVRLESWSAARITDVRITQCHNQRRVSLAIAPRFDGTRSARWRATVSLRGKKIAEGSDCVEIPSPELWWPAGQGGQPLYDITIKAAAGEPVLPAWRTRIGLREVRLDQSPRSDGGTHFRFIINDRPIFAKGANWVPVHSFPVEGAHDHLYKKLLAGAVAANMNMLRLWGGGIYEHDVFYDLCDELGLLVWHDFMFACNLCPGDKPFMDSVRTESAWQLRRLRNRACIALWCGNNEIYQLNPQVRDGANGLHARNYKKLFHKLLPDAVAKHDPGRCYWPSSPFPIEVSRKDNTDVAQKTGDAHFWKVYIARHPVEMYETLDVPFCSEFGMQAFPSPEVASGFCKAEDLNICSGDFDHHQHFRSGRLTVMEYILRQYKMPRDYRGLAYLSQIHQAHAIRTAVEHFRRSQPATMGSLYWQLNDCWPCTSFSSIEHGGQWKALHHAARRFYAPLLASIKLEGAETIALDNSPASTRGAAQFHAVCDRPGGFAGKLAWRLLTMDGQTLEAGSRPVRLASLEARCVERRDFTARLRAAGMENCVLHAALVDKDGVIQSENTAFFTAPRFLRLPSKPIQINIKRDGAMSLFSPFYHHRACLWNDGSQAVRFGDNFFDLLPGEERAIRVLAPKGADMGKLKETLRVFSLAHVAAG